MEKRLVMVVAALPKAMYRRARALARSVYAVLSECDSTERPIGGESSNLYLIFYPIAINFS